MTDRRELIAAAKVEPTFAGSDYPFGAGGSLAGIAALSVEAADA